MLVRPSLEKIGLKGNMRDGPWSYRILSLLAVSPIYSCVLITLGTLSGRHRFFATMASKMLGRFVPKTMKSSIVCPPGATATAAATTAAKATPKAGAMPKK